MATSLSPSKPTSRSSQTQKASEGSFALISDAGLETLQFNLRKVFSFYATNDHKLRPQSTSPRKKEVKAHPQFSDDEYLSMEGVLKFLYNYSIIDRFVRRKALALIMNNFKDYFNFSQFLVRFFNKASAATDC